MCRLEHKPSGVLLADGAYSYSFARTLFSDAQRDGATISLTGQSDNGILVEQRFTADPSTSWIEESLTLTNKTKWRQIQSFRCGFVLPLRDDVLTGYSFTAVPFRREGVFSSRLSDLNRHRLAKNERYLTFRLDELLFKCRAYVDEITENPTRQSVMAGFRERRFFAQDYGAEGWILTDDENGFLISKYNQSTPEYAVLDRVFLENGIPGLRWGGGAPPEGIGCIELEPGETYEFGVTRLSAFQGGLTQGYYTFRFEMESRGHGTPTGFNPPVHWNELYDNQLWSADGGHVDPKNREEFYRLTDVRGEAAKARAMGCDALYLDPGWETQQSSKIWDEGRLGKLDEFVASLRDEFGGLKLALHTPLSGWTGHGCHVPEGSALVNAMGVETYFACGASQQYMDESARRLRALADAGVCFFMFDGPGYQGPCWDSTHGHGVPSSLAEHVRATNHLARLVHETHPEVLIEMHDQPGRYWPPMAPMYHGHGEDAGGIRGFDERWGVEFMWNPIEDIRSGNSIALYYYNLAYGLPLYLHVDLRADNEHAIAFWWTASTCRHLGVGGTHADPDVVNAQMRAMDTYKRLKPYFTSGIFYGLDELTHVHSSIDGTGAVVNCFNLEECAVERDVRFEPPSLGLTANKTFEFVGADISPTRRAYVGTVGIPAQGHTLIEII